MAKEGWNKTQSGKGGIMIGERKEGIRGTERNRGAEGGSKEGG